MLEGAAVLDGVLGGERVNGSGDVGGEGGGLPHGGRGEEAGWNEPLVRLERADGGGFGSRVPEPLFGDGRFDFEHGAYGFNGYMVAGGVGEEWRAMQVVIYGDIDLAGAAAGGVDDEGGRGSVARGQVVGEEVEPQVFIGGAGGGGMFERMGDGDVGEEAGLNSAEHLVKVEVGGVDVAGHGGVLELGGIRRGLGHKVATIWVRHGLLIRAVGERWGGRKRDVVGGNGENGRRMLDTAA